MATDDCQKTSEELSVRGVVFTQEPARPPYGIEAVFRDDSGNWFSRTQRAGSWVNTTPRTESSSEVFWQSSVAITPVPLPGIGVGTTPGRGDGPGCSEMRPPDRPRAA
jgi:hypothetical protein